MSVHNPNLIDLARARDARKTRSAAGPAQADVDKRNQETLREAAETEAYVAAAKEMEQEIEGLYIEEENPIVTSEPGEGAWVEAWIWIPADKLERR